ncbi:MAG: photosystem II protein PsbQ [Pseudanabaenaceae cyanobacterium bins.68]|nr:photosystem II protein PsbQ [Pseudanabaenaceae cyanobacterium bins.68]
MVQWHRWLSVLILGLSLLVAMPAIAQPNPNAVARLMVFKERFNNLETYVSARDWTTVQTYIHGPLGTVRQDLRLATGGLSAKQSKQAKDLTKEFAADLVRLDFAAKDRDPARTEAAFDQARQDFEQLVNLIENS